MRGDLSGSGAWADMEVEDEDGPAASWCSGGGTDASVRLAKGLRPPRKLVMVVRGGLKQGLLDYSRRRATSFMESSRGDALAIPDGAWKGAPQPTSWGSARWVTVMGFQDLLCCTDAKSQGGAADNVSPECRARRAAPLRPLSFCSTVDARGGTTFVC